MNYYSWQHLFFDEANSLDKRKISELRSNPKAKRCSICHKYYIPDSRFDRYCEICNEESDSIRISNERNVGIN
jgi:hypothetical protein